MILQVGVKILIQDETGKYLFVRREPSFKAGPQKWDIPGGRIESDEALLDALKREVNEETGMELVSADKLLAAQDIFAEDKDLHVVRLTFIGKATGVVSLSDEHDDHRWMTHDEILAEEHVDSYLIEVMKDL
jgi:8-oxo-dGTP diphosphatase